MSATEGRGADDEIDQLNFDSEDVPRAVWAIRMKLVTDGFERPLHRHRRSQLILAIKGLITCETPKGIWMVPPQCALWIPGDMDHSVRIIGNLELYVMFLEPEIGLGMPAECCTLAVSPLLRELVIEISRLPRLYDPDGPDGRLTKTMLDQLAVAPIEHLHLPTPSDPRLRRVANAIMTNPSDRATIREWASRLGMSERALFRLIAQQIGMSFVRWRQQSHVMLALNWLSQGQSVQAVAFKLGYESASSFIHMFKRIMRQSPARYLSSRDVERFGEPSPKPVRH